MLKNKKANHFFLKEYKEKENKRSYSKFSRSYHKRWKKSEIRELNLSKKKINTSYTSQRNFKKEKYFMINEISELRNSLINEKSIYKSKIFNQQKILKIFQFLIKNYQKILNFPEIIENLFSNIFPLDKNLKLICYKNKDINNEKKLNFILKNFLKSDINMNNERFNNFFKGYKKIKNSKKFKKNKNKINLEEINKIIMNENSVVLDYKTLFFFIKKKYFKVKNKFKTMKNKIKEMNVQAKNFKEKMEIREKICKGSDSFYNNLLKREKLLKKEKFFVLQNYLKNHFEIKNLKKKLKNEIWKYNSILIKNEKLSNDNYFLKNREELMIYDYNKKIDIKIQELKNAEKKTEKKNNLLKNYENLIKEVKNKFLKILNKNNLKTFNQKINQIISKNQNLISQNSVIQKLQTKILRKYTSKFIPNNFKIKMNSLKRNSFKMKSKSKRNLSVNSNKNEIVFLDNLKKQIYEVFWDGNLNLEILELVEDIDKIMSFSN